MSTLTQTTAWRALDSHADAMRETTIAQLLADPARNRQCVVRGQGVELDWSRQKANAETPCCSCPGSPLSGTGRDGAQKCLRASRSTGTEDRPAWHVALRGGGSAPAEVRDSSAPCAGLADALRPAIERHDRQDHRARGPYRHRRLGPRSAHGARCTRRIPRCRRCDSIASRISIPPAWDACLPVAMPNEPYSSSPRKPSPRRKRLPTRRRREPWLLAKLPHRADQARHFSSRRPQTSRRRRASRRG